MVEEAAPTLGVSPEFMDSWDSLDRAIDRVVTSLPCSLSENINKLVLEQFAFRRLVQQEALKR